jgi:mannose-1-phosphate guanylyltransferase
MSTYELYAVVMAGGSGTRFWPASRAALPKQLLPLAGEKTLLQDTVDRLEGLVPPDRTMIVTSSRLLDAVRAQAPGLPEAPDPAELAATLQERCGLFR